MSGTLIVQNLQGPASGANANKIIVPAGQVLDASAGTFTPSVDQILQVKRNYAPNVSGGIVINTTSLVASGISVLITPKLSNSLILIDLNISMVQANSSASSLTARMYVNGSQMPSGSGYHIGYNGYGANEYSPMCFGGFYQASSTSSLTFEAYAQSNGGGQVRLVHPAASWSITAWEIKQ